MTPNEIEILIHCHCIASPHPRLGAEAVDEAIAMFLGAGILISVGASYYKTTSRGAALVNLLCQTPLPEQRWVDPRNGAVIE